MSIEVFCPYCGKKASLKDSAVIYGKSYGLIYICQDYPKCNAYVGVHKNTYRPLGTMANPELRELRKECHAKFDRLWQTGIFETRKVAYVWLSKIMNVERAHIGEFTIEQCDTFLIMMKMAEKKT